MASNINKHCLVIQFTNPFQGYLHNSYIRSMLAINEGILNIYISDSRPQFIFLDYNPDIISRSDIKTKVIGMGKDMGWDICIHNV